MSSLSSFLEEYNSSYAEDVIVVEDPITVEYETTAYYKALENKNPVLWFKKITNFPDFEIASNVLGSPERMARVIGCKQLDLFKRWSDITSHSGSISINESKAAVKKVVSAGDEVNLLELPVCKHFLQDGSELGFPHYITSGLAVARDPSSPETINMSYARMQVLSKTEYAFDLGSKGHFEKYVESSKRLGRPLSVSIVIGAHPIYYMLAAAFIENEYSKASKILEDAEYTNGITNDIPVPSEAEIVIEAEVNPGEFVEEGPFSEFTGYVSKTTTGNVGHVKAILRKRKAVYYDIIPSNSNEHVNLFSMPRNCAISRMFEEAMPPASEYRLEWPPASAHFLAFCEVLKAEPGLAKQAGLALLALDPLFTKIAFVTEGKTELNLSRFLVNLALDERKEERVSILKDLFCIRLEPTALQRGITAKIIINTKEKNPRFRKVVHDNEVWLESASAKVVFSHNFTSEGELNIIVSEDIDLNDQRDIIWAISTRMRPDEDVFFEKNHLVMMANKMYAEVPALPANLLERVKDKLKGRTPVYQ